jgi:ABC-type multidrug transport system fused ATPase/permease subunit
LPTLKIVIKIFRHIDLKQRVRLIFLTATIALTNLIDVLAIGLIAVLGQIAISGFGVNGLGELPNRIVIILGIQNSTFQLKVSVISLLIAFLLMSKTLLGVFLSWNMLKELSTYSANVSQKLSRDFFNQNFLEIIKRSPQEVNFNLGYGVNSLLLNVLGNFCLLLGDVFLLIVLISISIVVDVNFTILATVIFGIIGIFVNRIISRRARQIGIEQARLLVRSDKSIIGLMSAYKDYFVKNLLESQVKQINKTRSEISKINATVTFLPQVSKYVIEVILVLTVVIMGFIAFTFNDAIQAVPILLVFFAVISRMAPAVIRIQQYILVIKSNIGYSNTTLEVLDSIQKSAQNSSTQIKPSPSIDGSRDIEKIVCEQVSFKYSGSSNSPTVENFSFEFVKGKNYAITGPSGSGKSTLINMIIGLIPPDSGQISIFGMNPIDLISARPGKVGFVPQQIFIIDGTLRENIVLDAIKIQASDEEVIRILNTVKLGSWFSNLEDGLNTKVSSLNSKLSGGQVQRLGIARSLITNPEILILDESTSALDQKTEHEINQMLFELRPKITILAIAHRPTTLQLFDNLLYMDKGRLLATGNFPMIEPLLKPPLNTSHL